MATATALLALPAVAQNLSSVSLSPASVIGGVTSTGTVTLSANAPTGGKVVNLSSGNTGAATVSSSTVTVAAGTKTKTFVINTIPKPNDATAVITATMSSVSKTATLTVKAPATSAASVSPTSVTGGTGATLTVTLTGNAPSVGTVVTLTSGTLAAATLPASVTVAAGAKTATAAVTTLGVDANATVTLTATAGGVAKTASLTVARPAVTGVSLSPATIPGGGTSMATITLSGPAGPSGATVTLTSSKPTVATVPTNAFIAAGQATATFTVTGTSLPAGGTSTITATWNSVAKTATLTLSPSVSLQAISLSPSNVRGGVSVPGTVTLSGAAPSGGVTVTLSSNNTAAATVPASVTVAQGQATGGFTVTTAPVSSSAPVTVTATAATVTKTAPLTVEPAALTGLSLSPESIPGGAAATGTLTLDGPAGPAGATVGLSSANTNVATVPASALVAAGRSTGTFTVSGAPVSDEGVTTIQATLGADTLTADLMVTRAIGILSGIVRDTATGFTVPSAHVALTSDPGRETWTDGNGHYELDDVPAGSHSVEVNHDRYSPATSASVVVANGQSATVPPVTLTPLPGTISGTVVDQGNGDQPLEGAIVTEATGLHSVTTDANGHFELTGLSEGYTYLAIRKSGYRSGATAELGVDGGRSLEIVVGVSPSWAGDVPGEIEGVVRDSAGNPVGGATVSAVGNPGLSATTGGDGRYHLVVPGAAGWVLEAQKEGYRRTLSRWFQASAGDRPYHLAHDFILPLANSTGTVELRAYDPVSRNPYHYDLWFRTPLGLWHAPVPDSGTRTVAGVTAGLVWDCLGQRTLAAGGTLTVRCMGDPIVPPGTPRWATGGFVANRYTFEPVAGATVTLANGATVAPVTTNENGLFSYASGPLGSWSATASAPGFLDTPPWTFTAEDNQADGVFYGAVFWPEMPPGSVHVTAPADGAVLTGARILVSVTFSPGRTGDQLLWVRPWLSTGYVSSVTTTFAPDGRSADLTIDGRFENGPLTIGVEAITQSGAGLTFERNVTVNLPSHPTALVVSPSILPEESLATGTVTIEPPAPAGGTSVLLSSSSPAVSVPPSVSFAEGETSRTFSVVASAVTVATPATIIASVGAFAASADVTVNPTVPPPFGTDLAEGDLSAWRGFADPPYTATVSPDTTRVKEGSSSLRFVTDSGFDCGIRYDVPGGAHWDLRGINFLTFWSFGEGTEAYQGEQPVVVLRGPGGSIRLQPTGVQTVNGEWRFHRVPLGDASDWIVTTEGSPSIGDITSFEIHQDTWGMGLTVTYDGFAFVSDLPEDLAEGTAGLWGTFASDNAAVSVVDDATSLRSGAAALRFDTASGFDTGLVYPKAGAPHWNLSDVRTLMLWIRAENANPFQGNQPVFVLRSPSGSIQLEPGDTLVNTPGWRYYEVPLDGAYPWTRSQTGTPSLEDVNAIEIHDDTWGYGFRLYVDGVSVGRPMPLLVLPASSTPAGSTVTANVFLSEAAPAGGRAVQLSSADPFVASVPVSVVVPEGARSATFPVTAGTVTIGTPVSLSATDRGFSAQASLRVDPVADVASLALGASTVIGGLTVSGSVTIGAPAWVGGTAVFLTSSNPAAASVPSAVTVPTGATTATFSVATGAVASETPVTFTANAGAATAAASLLVTPAPPLELASVSAAPGYVSAGATLPVTVTMTAPAPPGGRSIALSSSAPELLSVPASVLVPAGTMQATATATAPPTAGEGSVTVTATDGPIQMTTTVNVIPSARIAGLSFASSGGFPGESVTGSVTLTAAAPATGYSVPLVSSLPGVVSVPANVVVPAGSLTTTFQAAIAASGPGGVANISASQHGVTKTATVAAVTLSFAGAYPSIAAPGQAVKLNVALTAPVPAGRTVELSLSSSAPAFASVPATATMGAGQTYHEVAVTRAEVAGDSPVDFTVSALDSSRTAHLVLEPLKVRSVTGSWGHTTMNACSQERLVVSLNAAAPSGGASIEVSIAGGYTEDGVPISGSTPPARQIDIPAGSSSASITVRSYWASAPASLVLTARLGSSAASGSLAIVPGTSWVAAIPSSPARGTSLDLRLRFSGGGPLCRASLDIDAEVTSSNPSVLSVSSPTRFEASEYFGFEATEWRALIPVPPTASPGTTRITVTADGVSSWADVSVPEASMSTFLINPSAAPQGAEVRGVVTLDAPAPAGGVTVLLQASDTSMATVPATVEIPAGASFGAFVLTPNDTVTGGDSIITASLGGASRTVTFKTLPPGAAVVVGRVVDGADYDRYHGIPGAVAAIGPGQFVTGPDGAFRLYSEPGPASVSVTASGFVPYASAPLSLTSAQSVDLGTIHAQRLAGGPCTHTGRVVTPQGAGVEGANGVFEGIDVAVTTNSSGFYSISLPAYRDSFRMTVAKLGYPTWTQDVIAWSGGPECGSGVPLVDFVLDPEPRPVLERVSFETPVLPSGAVARAVPVLTGPAHSGGQDVTFRRVTDLASGKSFGLLRIPQGETGYGSYFEIQAPAVTVPTTVEYAFFHGGVTKQASIQVVPETVSFSCSTYLIVAGTSASCTIVLKTGPAPAGGATVAISDFGSPFVTVVTEVVVPAGLTTATIEITAAPSVGFVYQAVILRATWGGGYGERSFSIGPPTISSFIVTPATALGGSSALGSVTLTGPAPPYGGAVLDLQSSLPEATVPESLTIPTGETSATFSVGTSPVAAPQAGAISADLTALGIERVPRPPNPSRTVTFVVAPPGMGVSCTPSSVVGGQPSTCLVTVPAAVPEGGAIVNLTSSSPNVVIPSSVTIPQGQRAKTFNLTTLVVSASDVATIRATLGPDSAEAAFTARPLGLSNLTLDVTSLRSGQSTTGRVGLDGPAPSGGAIVSLSSGHPAVSLPVSVAVPSGSTSANFAVTSAAISGSVQTQISATLGESVRTFAFDLLGEPPVLTGLAPGVTLPGGTGILVYGTGLSLARQVVFTGPVIAVGGTTQLCNIGGSTPPLCNEFVLPATPRADGLALSFDVPAERAPGYYYVEARAGTVDSSNGKLVLVDEPLVARAAVAPEQHKWAQRIHPGQIVEGTLSGTAPNCPYGATDYNQYFFFATAGSRVNVRMERVDTSVPWSDPSSLDPQLEVVAPDGFIYGNLARFNDRPGVDFNATITNASLPKTGLYVILAETARGSGAYRLSFSFSSLAPSSPEDRVIPAAGNHFTGHVGDAITAWAQVLDPRGHPLSGASLSFQQVVDPGDAGTVQFTPGANVESSSSGVAAVNATLTSFGRARFAPSLQQTFAAPAAEGLELPALSAEARPDEQIPLYPAVAMRPFAIGAFDGDLLEVESSRFERFPLAPRPARSGPIEETPAAGGVRSLASSARASTQAQAYGPEDEARGEVPVARFEQPGLSATSCQDGLRFHAFAVLPSAQINAPLSVTLEDLTPSTGQETPNGPVGDKGIYGHRIEKEIRLRIRVHDASGNEPDYPVLVSLSVGGRAAGQLILDPDGSRIECPTATFIWHERDANGVIVALNEIVGYRLGTYSDFVGLDRSLKPVWNWTELFQAKTFTPGQEQPSVQVFGVHPEPGKPDRVFCRDYFGQLCGDSFRYWTGYKAYENGRKQDGTPRFETNYFTTLSSYHLVDKYENTLYGYSGTSVSEAVPSSDVQFAAHEPGEANPQSYKLRTRWTNDPSWPSGLHPATLSVHYPEDPDWPAGDVTREITLNFDAGVSHALSKHGRYDLIRPDGTRGVDDGTFPIRAYAKATAAQLPKTEAGDGARLVLLAYRGEVVPGEWPELEPTETGSRVWTPEGDHWRIEETRTTSFLESAGPSAFRFTLIDHDWNVIQDGEFQVHRCPRFDHAAPGSGRPCDLAPVLSVNGRIDSLALNPGGAGANESRGYLAIELTRAPEGLGIYYVRVESLSNEYRIRRQSDFVTSAAAVDGEFQGAFKLVDVADFPCPDARCGIPECGTCTGSPNYVSTGTYTTLATDLVVPTSGPAISVSRRYVSTPTADGVVGPGWTSSLESRVYLAPYISGGVRLGTEANVVLPTGMRYKFRLNPITGHYDPPAGRKDDLVRTADGSFDLFLERGSGSVYRFDKHGLLVSETDEFGNVVAWERSPEGRLTRIADLSGTGRYVTVGWTTGGKVHTLTDSASRTITYDYDPQGRLAGVTDPAARRTRYDYLRGRDSTALLTRISDPWGRAITDVTYDVADRTKTYTEQGRTYSYTYTASNRTTKSDDSGHSTENYFDPDSGAITARSDPGDSFNKVFDSEGRPTQVTDAAGVVTGYSYDDEGHVLTVTRNAGQTGAVRYDYAYDPAFPDKVASVTPKNPASNAFDRAWQGWRYEYHPTGSTRPGGLKKVYRVASDGATADTVSEYEYDAQGRVTRQTTAGGAQTDYAYDNVGNLQTVTGPAGTTGRPVTSYQHDALGRVADVTDPLGKVTHYTYDTLGRVLTVTLPAVGGRTFTTTYSYDHLDGATGFLYTEITDPNGRLTRLGYDVDGRLRRSVDASGGATLYGYSGKHLTTITDPNGNVTTYAYDGAQRLASTSFPDGGQETYTYWNDGLLRTKTDRRGTVVTYTYDAFKRLVTKAYSTGGTVTNAYDGQKLLTVTDTTVTPAETHTFSYDSRYRLSSAAQAGRGTTGYTYTADDRVETLTLPSGPTATYGYNPDGSLHTLQWSAVSGAFTWDYTARGQYDTLTFPNGQLRDYGYDDQGRLTSLTNALGASTLASYAYGYDVDPQTGQPTLLGQRTSQTATLPSQGLASAVTRYGYDPLYQLTRAEYPAGTPFNSEVHTWSYDSIGNRMTQGSGASVQAYTYLKSPGNPLNGQRLEGDGVDAMTYDPAGNLGTRQGPAGNFTFGYDPENRLKTITGPENSTYTYDYQGRRTSKTVGGVTTTYLYDGLNLVSETTGGQTTYFLNGPGIDEPLAMSRAGAVSYFSVDSLGSVVATNDPSGTVTHSVVFDAWGNVRAETGTRAHPFTYTGREVGEAGFHFYRARFYQPSIGRFIQEDPIGYRGDSENLYRYAGNDAVNRFDPSGLWSPEAHDSMIGLALGGRATDWDIAVIQQAGRDFDKATQGLYFSNLHSMRRAGQSPERAMENRDRWVEWMLRRAKCAETSGRHNEALRLFGQAIHPVMDATSPVHNDRNGQPGLWRSMVRDGLGHSPNEVIGSETKGDIPWATYEQMYQQLYALYQSVFSI